MIEKTISNKMVWLAGAGCLLASVFAAVFFSQPLLYAAPLVLLVSLLLVQHPVVLFYGLIGSIPWSVEANVTETLGTDFPDEPLMLLTAFTVLVLLLVRSKQRGEKKLQSPLLGVLLLGFAWSVVTVVLSTHVQLSLKFLLAKSWYLLAFVGAPLVLIDADDKLIKRSAFILVGSMLAVTTVGLIRHAALHFTFAGINEALSPFFRNHVNYSALLVFLVPLQLAFYRLAKNKTQRICVLLSLLLVLAALGLSYARGAWLALVAGLVAYWLIKKGWLLQTFVVAVLVVSGLVYWLQHNDRYLQFAPNHDTTIFHENFSEHLEATIEGKDVSTAERFYRWVAGVRMGRDRWTTGFGPTTFYQNYQSYTIPAFRTWVSNNPEHSTVHNYFLLLLIEQGAPGLLLFLVLVGTLFWQAQKIYNRTLDPFWKTTAAAIAAILWMQCTVNFLSDLIETDKVGSVFYLCLSFLVIADAKTRNPEKA